MKIAVNAVLAYEQPRGVGNYLNVLLPAIAEIDKENEYCIYYGKWMKAYSFTGIKQSNFKLIELDIENSQIHRNLFLAIKLPNMVKRFGADIYWVPDSQATLYKPCRMISTIHDLAEYVIPEKYSKKTAFIRRTYVRHQIRISDHIITVSEYSKDEIRKRFGLPDNRVSVVYNALAKKSNEWKTEEKSEDYILFVSEVERAKNLGVLIEAYASLNDELRKRFELKVVGKKGNNFEEVQGLIRQLGIEDRISFYGYLSDIELDEMYKKATVFVFPSVFEGFGYPVLEAMARGVPVICSNVSSIPEVGGDAVRSFNPYDSTQLVEQLVSVLEDDGLRRNMIEEGLKRSKMFSSDKMAVETVRVLTECI